MQWNSKKSAFDEGYGGGEREETSVEKDLFSIVVGFFFIFLRGNISMGDKKKSFKKPTGAEEIGEIL